jgi:membrane-bound metal-dependent hydrolase YbcI (DUF457 family)
MTVPSTAELESKEKSNKVTGTKIVVFGALASIILWMVVLAGGSPIRPFTSLPVSFAYALVITAPVIVLSLLTIARHGRERVRA